MTEENKVPNNSQVDENGQNKCPKCGSPEISNVPQTDKLICEFCRHVFEVKKVENNDIKNLTGVNISTGASNIQADSSDMVTLKCESCGAEVVIDTNEALQAKCHWCRNVLSLNSQIPNGAVPDVVLPFFIAKEDAEKTINSFVKKRSFFANKKFKKEFTTENINGVYFPYMIVDVNAHCKFSGEGEHLLRKYNVGTNDHPDYRYDAEAFKLDREFDIIIDDLTIESSKDKLDTSNENNTNNVINAIMPFDIINCVKWDANYLKGYTSEKRDVNVEELSTLIKDQSTDVAKFSCNDTLKYYDRGVRWDVQNIDIKGEDWKAALLPVWIYSYMEEKKGKKLIHYVAVNARTKEVMGSVPINMGRLFLVSAIIETLCILLMLSFEDAEGYQFLLLLPGIAYYYFMISRYRNEAARHTYETETKNKVSNLDAKDEFIEKRKRLKNRNILGCNNTSIKGVATKKKLKDILEK